MSTGDDQRRPDDEAAAAHPAPEPAPGGAPPFDDTAELPPPSRRSTRGLVLLVVAGLVAVAAAVGAVAVLGGGDGHPQTWDRRVVDLVAFVEDERDLRFEHPVHVDFLTDEEYTDRTTAEEGDLSDEEREELELYAGAFRALGLIEGDVDLFDEVNELSDTGTLAYYDHDDDRVVVRGTEVTPALEITLVHELVHALQDQHFDLSRMDELETDGESVALRALVEGDAQRIEDAYYETLDDEDKDHVDEAETGDDAPELDVPDVLATYFGAPYFLGEGLIAVLLESGGDDAIDDAFMDPPTTEEQLLDPFAYLDDDEALTVEVPDVPADAEVLDDGDFGSLTWFLALSERIDPMEALRAVDGWGGDAYSLYEHEGRACIVAAFVGDDEDDTEEMQAALEAWAAEMPDNAATASRRGESAVLQSCDPGADAALEVTGASSEAIGLPVVRTFLAVGAMQQGAGEEQARCFGHELVGGVPLEALMSEEAPSPEIQQQVLDIVQRCR